MDKRSKYKQGTVFDDLTESKLDTPDYEVSVKLQGVSRNGKRFWRIETDYAIPSDMTIEEIFELIADLSIKE